MFRKKPKINPHVEQQAKLQEIGSQLQQLRTEQGLSLETVTKKTRIPMRLLKAIEEGDLASLPEPIYVRGLIKQFADFLGLEGTPLAKSFPVYMTSKATKSYFSWRFLPSLQLRPIHLYFIYILLVIFSVRGISHVLKQSVLEMSSLEHQSQLQTQQPTDETKTSSSATKVAAKAVVVNLKLKEKCWVRVVVDGKTEFEGVLPEGTHKTWIANKQLTVRAGNAGGVLVSFNDNKPQQLGKPGEMQEITFNARSPVSNP